MSHLTAPPAAQRPSTIRSSTPDIVRWAVSFTGFPLGGLAALLVTGPVDRALAAAAGGALTGVVLGLVQALALRLDRGARLRWIAATTAGLSVGLTAGAAFVGYATALGYLAVQGALSGFAVGVAQAAVLAGRARRLALIWPVYLATAWAVGWVVTTSIGVQVDDQFTVFGAAGALTVTALTAVLPVTLARATHRHAEKSI